MTDLYTNTPADLSIIRKALRVRARLLGRSLSVIPLGTSLTAGSSGSSNGLWRYGSTGYAEAALYRAGGFRIIRNAGAAGNTSAQILARVDADVIAYAPDVCLVESLTNDINTSVSLATSMLQLEQIVNKLLDADILPVIVTPPPLNSKQANCRIAQLQCYRLARAYGLPLLDMYRVLVNPLTGNFISSPATTTDNIHPNNFGIDMLAADFGPKLANLANLRCPIYLAATAETTAGQTANMIANGNFALQASPPTPDKWVASTTDATLTAPTAALPYTGVAATYAKTVDGAIYALQASGAGSQVNSGWTAGDKLIFSGQVSASGLTVNDLANFSIIMLGSGTLNDSAKPINGWNTNGDFLFSNELITPAGITNFAPQFYVTRVGTFVLRNWTLWNETAAAAVWTPSAS